MLSLNFPLEADPEAPQRWRLHEDPSEADATNLMRTRHNMWVFNHLPVDGQPVLVFMISGCLVKEMKAMSTASMVGRVLAALRIAFPDAPAPVGTSVGRWDSNEFTRGGWSFHKPGWRGPEDIKDLIEPLHGASSKGSSDMKVLFAGEGTSQGRPGYMDGAIESGQREAKRLLELFPKVVSQPVVSKL